MKISKATEIVKRNKTILSNFSYLTILELFVLVAPLITYPYLVRVLGRELYGWVITAQITASYFSVLIDFGFKRISARHVANNCNDIKELSTVVSTVLWLRFALWLISLVVYFALLFAITSYRNHFLLFAYSFIMTLNSFLFLDFYFQGIENMKYITYINIIVRSIFIGATFIFIKTPADYIYVPLIWGIGYIIGGVASLWIVFHDHHLRFIRPHLKTLKYHIKESTPIFISDVMLTVKDKLNYNIMGAMIGMSDIVIYDVGSKISGLLQKPFQIICTVLFPRFSRNPNVNRAKKAMVMLFCISLIAVAVANIFLPWIVRVLIDTDIELSAVRLYTLAPVILSISGFIAINVFIAFGNNRYILSSTVITTIGYVLLLVLMYFNSMLDSVMSFVVLTICAYTIEMIYRVFICRRIFNKM